MPVGAPIAAHLLDQDLSEYYHERCASMREWTEYASKHKERNCSAGVAGKYACARCGWRWTPRTNSPDPPRACARCRSAYWQSTPVSCRANSPSDPKWCVESQSVARRRQKRHLTRLKELAAEFGFALPPVRYDLSVAPPVFPLPQGSSQPVEPRLHFNEPVPSGQDYWHDCRHTYARRLRQAGVSLGNIAELLGHKGLAMSRRYAHLSISNLYEAVSRIANSTPVAPERLRETNENRYLN